MTDSLNKMVKILCNTAIKGLSESYGESSDLLPYTRKSYSSGVVKPAGFSIRYAAMCHIGILKWLQYHPDDKDFLPDLWPRIMRKYSKDIHIGDCALILWAGIEGGREDCRQFAESLAQHWRKEKLTCNSVELGWIVQACTIAMNKMQNLETYIKPVLNEAHQSLIELFDPIHNLFHRHNRVGISEIITRRVACFADQVYPIVALSSYGGLFDDEKSIALAAKAIEQICRFQGSLGQWQWHYDVVRGKVCEEYPIFSVHQDSMAPMAIFSNERASGVINLKEMELGMRWLFGENELEENLVLEDQGIIWRDIERREPRKLSRLVRGLCCVLETNKLHHSAGRWFNSFVVNLECRPYHLGWILYAWADFKIDD